MPMTLEAKELLSRTIRGLHDVLIPELLRETARVYQLGLAAKDARLDEATARKRARLEAFLAEQVRSCKRSRSADEHLRDVVKQAASTLVNRLVVLRLLEAGSRRRNPVLSGGQTSQAYLDFVAFAPPLADDPQRDDSRGYEFLLGLVFEELSVELPGLFGTAGIADLIITPWPTLHDAIKALGQPGLESCWTDDMTLGWVYQYWNDPDRKILDAKLHKRGRLENHEIASKTQMFTERYMVDWLLQNTLGQLWLAICKKHDWTPAAEVDGTLATLDARRAEWRRKRASGEVTPTALMPLYSDAERRWAYYVPQPLPADAPGHAPASIREIKLLDPAVGSGHFLVIAFELLVALYREEARHRGEEKQDRWSDRAIAECILENNLHGLDIDPRAIQIAAAALWLKAREFCSEVHPRHLNLVASSLRLAGLPKNDPALVELRATIARDTGIPPELTDRIVESLGGADHLGSLLRVDQAVETAIEAYENPTPKGGSSEQTDFLATFAEVTRKNVLANVEAFLAKHTSGDDLGLRLRGEQLAVGVRFTRMMREGKYDIVIGNPPYHGMKKLASSAQFKRLYPAGRANLFACFIARAFELVRCEGIVAMAVPTNWMYAEQYERLRKLLLSRYSTSICADLGSGAFQQIGGEVVMTSLSVWRHSPHGLRAIQILDATSGERDHKVAACVAMDSFHTLRLEHLSLVEGWPLVYRWSTAEFERYQITQKLSDVCEARYGSITGDDPRFLRTFAELAPGSMEVCMYGQAEFSSKSLRARHWFPYIKGAAGKRWIEPVEVFCNWAARGLECKIRNDFVFGSFSRLIQNEQWNFVQGIAFTSMGAEFGGRIHRAASVIGAKGRSVFSASALMNVLCMLNSLSVRKIAATLNPSLDFNIGDVNRLPFRQIAGAEEICAAVTRAFGEHESHREPSVEFRRPGPSPWRHVQDWAQTAVDRSEDTPLPLYTPEYDPEQASDHLSFALGAALGRFSAEGKGILDPTNDDLSRALPHGICFLDTTLGPNDLRDSLGHPAARALLIAWDEHGPAIAEGSNLRGYLAHKFFELHRKMYDNRPIHWPLSSEKRTFVAWITIHRWDVDTLRHLLADHLYPTRARLDGELPDLRSACDGKDKKAVRIAQKRLEVVQKARAELTTFIAEVEQCAEKGPPPPEPRPKADGDHADLEASIRAISATLSVLLAPTWRTPGTSKVKRDTEVLDRLLSESLRPALVLLDEQLSALRAARADTERRLADALKARSDLIALIATVEQRVGQYRRPAREVDARYEPNLDDGVRVNSAALWPLLMPQWREPKKWWSEIATGEGKQGCDWSHLAMRYWPRLVDAKCQTDPSLAVAHGSFWRYHPARAWAWELRLQDEVDPDFRIEQEPYRGDGGHEAHRTIFLADHPIDALQIIEKEVFRRVRKHDRLQPSIRLIEAGLWTSQPRACSALELRVLKRYRKILRKKRKAGLLVEDLPNFRLVAPDEPDARRALLAAFPDDFARRRQFLETDLDLEIEDDDDDDDDDDVIDDEDSGTADEDQGADDEEEDDDA